jgi:transcriptional regulator with XRE-family HTH domain
MSDDDLSPEENKAISGVIREELARRRMTRGALADRAKLSLSTLEKALAGQRSFTLATVVRLEEALGLPLRKPRAKSNGLQSGVAPDELGSYARTAVSFIEGPYMTIRASFSDPTGIYTYQTDIRWDEELSALAFQESERIDNEFRHSGLVSVPHQSGYIYLVTNRHGQYRMAILSRPTITGEMYGLLSTLHLGKGTQLTPVATPIVLVPLKALGKGVTFGRFAAASEEHKRLFPFLRRATEDPFLLMVTAR